MAIDTFEIRHQMNEEAAELESLRTEVGEMDMVVADLEDTVADLEKENRDLRSKVIMADSYADDAADRNGELTEAIQDALEDLRTLPEIPLNLVEAAVENIVSDLRKALEVN